MPLPELLRQVPPLGPMLRLARRSLLAHRLRSALSALGIVFGVAAVVAMSSVGEGARREAVAQVEALGIDTVIVRAREGERGSGVLTLRDDQALAEVMPGLKVSAPVRETQLTADAGGRQVDAVVVGTTPAYGGAARITVRSGRFVSDLDVKERKRVAVLGHTVATRLFPFGEALGARLRLGSDLYDVVGVLHERASPRARGSAIRARDVNRAVFIPLTAFDMGAGGPDMVDEVVLRLADASQVTAAAEAAKRVLARSSGGQSFEVVVPREILRQRERTQRVFDVVTGAIAALGLLVGGIGIMNVMLASVAERTREIGIRRAVGATRQEVALQFLAESVLLSASGGLAGLALGAVGAALIQHLAGWPTALSVGMLLMATLMAAAVGVGFGLYPALRAARLEPMEALRAD
jgi:putative ABC transport system permease protein